MKAELHFICGQLLSATLNGLYQGVIICLVVGLLLRLLVRTNAATRHAVWFGCLMLVVLIIPAHYWLDRPWLESISSEFAIASQAWPPASSDVSKNPFSEAITPFAPEVADSEQQSGSSLITPDPEHAETGKQDSLSGVSPSLDPLNSTTLSGSSPVATLHTYPSWEDVLSPISWNPRASLSFPVLVGFALAWLVIGGFRLMVLGLRLMQLRNWSKSSGVPSAELLQLFARVRTQGKVTRNVELRISGRKCRPVVLGFIRPVVLLPTDMSIAENFGETEQVLRHELAHVRRYDDWVNLMQHVVQSVLFFHPAVYWIGKRLSLEREVACDDHVLQQGSSRRNYALVLTTVAGRIHQQTTLLAPGVSNRNSQLQQRISMILNTRRNSSPRLAKGRLLSVISATALLAVLALYSAPRFVLAAGAAEASAAPSTSAAIAGVSFSVHPAVQVVAAADVAPAVVAVTAEPEVAPNSEGVDPGPKFKPEAPGAEPPEPPDAELPVAPGILGNEGAPKMPTFPRAARIDRANRKQRMAQMDGERNEDGSVEERLKRLEKMVRALMDEQGGKRTRIFLKDGQDRAMEQDMEKMQQSAERQAARAEQQAKRAVEQAERANKELEARLEQDQPGQGNFREGLQRQLEALRNARENLGQEIERLNHQIEKLEKERQRSERGQQKRSEKAEKKLQAQTDSTSQDEK